MTSKILFVDDERNILDGIRRNLRGSFTIETALGPERGLEALRERGPYAVVVTDLRMPVMGGVQFLSRVSETSPNTVRMMLTGNADLRSAIEAVNQGNVFRFMTKPCSPVVLKNMLEAGLRQHSLVTAEKELLEKTLKGCIEVMVDLLSIVNPEAYGRTARIRNLVRKILHALGISDAWSIETAAMLSQVGWITLPPEMHQKLLNSDVLTEKEQKLYHMHPMIASDLIGHIPRLEKVGEIIAYQEKHFDGSGVPRDSISGDKIPQGSRILKVVLDYDLLEMEGVGKGNALFRMKRQKGSYDPSVLAALEKVFGIEAKFSVQSVPIQELETSMILGEDVKTNTGQLLVARGQEINPVMLQRLAMLVQADVIKEKLNVFVPAVDGQ